MVSKVVEQALLAVFPDMTVMQLNTYDIRKKHAELLIDTAEQNRINNNLNQLIADFTAYTPGVHSHLYNENLIAWHIENQAQRALLAITQQQKNQKMEQAQSETPISDEAHIAALKQYQEARQNYAILRSTFDNNNTNWVFPTLRAKNELLWRTVLHAQPMQLAQQWPAFNNFNQQGHANNNNYLSNNNNITYPSPWSKTF